MFEDLSKAVAGVLYSTQDTHLWEVMAEKDKELCRNIVSAVLTQLQSPDNDMLKAGDDHLAALLRRLDSSEDRNVDQHDVLRQLFEAMIIAARGETAT